MTTYEIKTEEDHEVGVEILKLYYGNLWESILDRIHHKSDGHLFTINRHGDRFRIYRKFRAPDPGS